jgi:hypothetical protein
MTSLDTLKTNASKSSQAQLDQIAGEVLEAFELCYQTPVQDVRRAVKIELFKQILVLIETGDLQARRHEPLALGVSVSSNGTPQLPSGSLDEKFDELAKLYGWASGQEAAEKLYNLFTSLPAGTQNARFAGMSMIADGTTPVNDDGTPQSTIDLAKLRGNLNRVNIGVDPSMKLTLPANNDTAVQELAALRKSITDQGGRPNQDGTVTLPSDDQLKQQVTNLQQKLTNADNSVTSQGGSMDNNGNITLPTVQQPAIPTADEKAQAAAFVQLIESADPIKGFSTKVSIPKRKFADSTKVEAGKLRKDMKDHL